MIIQTLYVTYVKFCKIILSSLAGNTPNESEETLTKYSALFILSSTALYLLISAKVSLKSSSFLLSLLRISFKKFLSSSLPFWNNIINS